MRDTLFKIVSVYAIVLIFFTFFFGLHMASTHREEELELWNDGYCDVCGGVWKYEQAVGHRYGTSYIYVCEDCGKRIEIDSIHKERKMYEHNDKDGWRSNISVC